ncbi:muconolactone Delta-isomerase family protein [Saccharopolyspora shandongensis]|uniref:muconolactone Delta-isomerase family protein n=1 Tax=Saccharopolyspora shandongensis TaxID=418495 RepID=UPI003F4CD168
MGASFRHLGGGVVFRVFDVADNERLHEILWNLPLFPYMTIEVTPLAQYPSDIALLGS